MYLIQGCWVPRLWVLHLPVDAGIPYPGGGFVLPLPDPREQTQKGPEYIETGPHVYPSVFHISHRIILPIVSNVTPNSSARVL